MDAEQTPEHVVLHRTLVDGLVERALIRSPEVEAAFRAVRRDVFLPDVAAAEVYKDRAIITKRDEVGRPVSSSSQPAIMAIMLEQLDLQPGQRVLEIGAGTGYNAALMAHIVGESGQVTTVDIDAELVGVARARLAEAGFDGVQVVCGDGMRGYAANAPYDRVILTVAGWDIAPEWLAQLAADGRLVLPLSFHGPQLSIAFERQDGALYSRSVVPCGFMPVRGPRAEPVHRLQVGGRWEFILMPDRDGQAAGAVHAGAVDAEEVEGWLRAPFVEEATGVEISGMDLLFKWALWAALYEPDYVLVHRLGDEEEDEGRDPLPRWPVNVNSGILGREGLALLAPPADREAREVDRGGERRFRLNIRRYGPDKTVAERLLRLLEDWERAGRPGGADVSVWAAPVDEVADVGEADVVLRRRWFCFGVRWE